MLFVLASKSTSIIASIAAIAGVVLLLILAKVAERLKFSGDFEFRVRNMNLLSQDEIRLEINLDATSFKKKRVFNELSLLYMDEGKEKQIYCLDYPLLPSSSKDAVFKNNEGHYGIFINPGDSLTCVVSFRTANKIPSNAKLYLSYTVNSKRYAGQISLKEDNAYYVRFKSNKKIS